MLAPARHPLGPRSGPCLAPTSHSLHLYHPICGLPSAPRSAPAQPSLAPRSATARSIRPAHATCTPCEHYARTMRALYQNYAHYQQGGKRKEDLLPLTPLCSALCTLCTNDTRTMRMHSVPCAHYAHTMPQCTHYPHSMRARCITSNTETSALWCH